MAKYSYEFKKQIVAEYLEGQGGYPSLASKHGMPSSTPLETWVAAYKKFGDKGLKKSRNQKNYSFEEKISIVESYLTSELSYQDLALQVGINNPTLITQWVNRFKAAGPNALRARKKGRKKTLSKSKDNNTTDDSQETNIDTSAKHVRELEDELLKLCIENAFFKELRRLCLEDEAKMRDMHESSPASEDSSNYKYYNEQRIKEKLGWKSPVQYRLSLQAA